MEREADLINANDENTRIAGFIINDALLKTLLEKEIITKKDLTSKIIHSDKSLISIFGEDFDPDVCIDYAASYIESL